MHLSAQQKRICEQVINVFETSKPEGVYSAISIYDDAPGEIQQITYGRSQTTETGNLPALLQQYIDAQGIYSEQLRSYLPKLAVLSPTNPKKFVLVDNAEFRKLLEDAGDKDPAMRRVQDQFFDTYYFQPAMAWADRNGFVLPLSALVIYDSFIHSGGILDFLRQRFPEVPPAKGGNEKSWISQYVDTRYDWLYGKPNLRTTVYRPACFKCEIARNNWDLSKLPTIANGVAVWGKELLVAV